MGFIIYNAEGVSLSLDELDREAAAFWNKEFQLDEYANPTPIFTNPDKLQGIELRKATFNHKFAHAVNWYDMIGLYISEQDSYCGGWANVVLSMIARPIGRHFVSIKDDDNYDKNPVKVMYTRTIDNNEIAINKDVIEGVHITLTFYKPYIDLINHWASKGYTQKKGDR